MRVEWSYQLRREIALLDEEEWEKIEPYLGGWIQAIKEHMRATGVDLAEARERAPKLTKAMDVYFASTGHKLLHPNEIYLSLIHI